MVAHMQVKLEDGPDAYAPDSLGRPMKNRVVRLGGEWDELADATGRRRRAAVIRQLVQWYLRYPGVKLPERPPRRLPAE
jgi:hypothetical protein